MIKGWDKALRTMTVGERSIFRITDPEWGYGETGVPPLIPPNAVLEFDIEVLDTQLPTTNIDFDSLATADNTPVSTLQENGSGDKGYVCVCVFLFLLSESHLVFTWTLDSERHRKFKPPMNNAKPSRHCKVPKRRA